MIKALYSRYPELQSGKNVEVLILQKAIIMFVQDILDRINDEIVEIVSHYVELKKEWFYV